MDCYNFSYFKGLRNADISLKSIWNQRVLQNDVNPRKTQ